MTQLAIPQSKLVEDQPQRTGKPSVSGVQAKHNERSKKFLYALI
jgi:hypothetical protein